MSVIACDPRHAALQAETLTFANIGPALVADSGAWVSEHTGGGNFAWSRRTYDDAAAIMISDDGTLGYGDSSEFGLWLARDDDDTLDPSRACGFSLDVTSIAEALTLAHAIEAGRAFALGFRA